MQTIDIGWGTLSGGIPATTVTGIHILAEGAKQSLLNEPQLLQDGTNFQIETPSKWSWKIKFFPGLYQEKSAYMADLVKVLNFVQQQPKYIRLSSNLWTTLHPSDVWVQVYLSAKDNPLNRSANLYAIELPLTENTPIDMGSY